jgi:hypothetical protein
MNEALSADDRRHARTSLIASLAFVITFLLSGVAWSGSAAPAPDPAKPAVAAATAPAENGPAIEQGELGCGCAEACLATD